MSDFDLVLLLFLFFLPTGGSKTSDLNPAAQILVAGSILDISFCGDLLGDVITPAGAVLSLNSVDVGDITCLGVLFDGVLLFVLLMLMLLVVFDMLLVLDACVVVVVIVVGLVLDACCGGGASHRDRTFAS